MNDPDVLSRLDRLEGYLGHDPENPALLADAFETALHAAAWDRAEFHLRHALALDLDRPTWLLREAHWFLAQHRWSEARERLLALQRATTGPERAAALAADLAYVALRSGDYAAGIAALEPVADVESGNVALDPSLELLWLRLLHHALDLERAMEWVLGREAGAPLARATAGVASLIALDAGDYASTLRWSLEALRDTDPVIEAEVARASIALGERDAPLALELLASALKRNGEDGRVWSALAFAQLLSQDLLAARSAFERAVLLLPEHIGTWHGLGWTALAQGDLPAAGQAFDAALSIDRNFGESHGAAAVVCALQGNAEGARHAIDIALRLDRTNLSARYAKALLEGDARNSASLMRLAERLLSGKRTPLGSDMMNLLRRTGHKCEA